MKNDLKKLQKEKPREDTKEETQQKPTEETKANKEENQPENEGEKQKKSSTQAKIDLTAAQKKKMISVEKRTIETEDGKRVLPPKYRQWQDSFDNFSVRQKDIFVISRPRSGTTWMQELVWCVVKGLDHSRKDCRLNKRFPFLEKPLRTKTEKTPRQIEAMFDNIEDKRGQRLIKTHFPKILLPYELWTMKPKVIYICRDPRDVCVSSYHNGLSVGRFSETIDEYADVFLNDISMCGSYWSHVLGFWNLRHRRHLFFTRYEELKKDLVGSIKKIAVFLGRKVSDKDALLMAEHLSFDSMKKNKSVNKKSSEFRKKEEGTENYGFIRKGQVGDWKNHFSAETIKKFEEWTKEHLKDSDFPYYKDY